LANPRWLTALASASAIVMIALNSWLLFTTFTPTPETLHLHILPGYELRSSLSIGGNSGVTIQSIDRHEMLDRTDIVVRVDHHDRLTKRDAGNT
jgi:hypothetical protein